MTVNSPGTPSVDIVDELADQLQDAVPAQATVETNTYIADDPRIEVDYPTYSVGGRVNSYTSVARRVGNHTYGLRFRGEDPNGDGTVTVTYEVSQF